MHGPVNLVRLTQLIDLVDAPQLLFRTYQRPIRCSCRRASRFLSGSSAATC